LVEGCSARRDFRFYAILWDEEIRLMKKYLLLIFTAVMLAACVRPAPTPEPAAFATNTLHIVESAPTAIILSEDTPDAMDEAVLPTEEEEPTPFIITPTEENPVTPTSIYTATPETPKTPKPTNTPTDEPTPEVPGFDPIARWNSPRNIDDFSTDEGWVSNNGELPNTGNIRLEIADGMMYVTGKKEEFDTWWLSSPTLGDMYFEMTINTGDCKETDSYGAVIRAAPSGEPMRGYIAAFNCQGEFFVRRIDGTDPYIIETLFANTQDKNIRRGANKVNVLGFLAVENEFTVYANGYELGTFYDFEYESGRYGVYVAAGEDGPYTYKVKQIRIWDLRFK
jgi:hypothetical protein